MGHTFLNFCGLFRIFEPKPEKHTKKKNWCDQNLFLPFINKDELKEKYQTFRSQNSELCCNKVQTIEVIVRIMYSV